MARAREPFWSVGATASSAVLFAFGFGFHPIAMLTWVAPLPVFALAPRVSRRVAGVVALLAYVLGSAPTWPYYASSIDVPLPVGVGIILGFGVVFAGGTLLLRALVHRGHPVLAALAPSALWISALLALLLNPVGVIYQFAVSVTDIPVVTQVAAVTGGWGVEAYVLLVPAVVAVLTAPGVARPGRARTAAVGVLATVAVLAFGTARLAEDRPGGRDIATVASNEAHWNVDVTSSDGRRLLESYARTIRGLPSEVDTVVLPEGNFGATEETLPALVASLGGLHKNVVVGVILSGGGRIYDVSLGIPAAGGPSAIYRKWHVDGAQTPGTSLKYLAVGNGPIALANCMDVNFPNPSRNYGQAGTRLLAVPAADGNDNGWQHSRQALLRGVENGYSVAWSAQRGTSLLADSRGRSLAESHTTGTKGFNVSVATVPPGSGSTFYARHGDWFAWLCLAATALMLALTLRGRRERSTGTADGHELKSRPDEPTAVA